MDVDSKVKRYSITCGPDVDKALEDINAEFARGWRRVDSHSIPLSSFGDARRTENRSTLVVFFEREVQPAD